MGKRSSRDLLSNLPLGVIHTILEHVPIRDAVKTSLLARQWRYKWYLSTGIGSCRSSLVFPHLRFIELTSDLFYDEKVLSVVARLSMDAPNLHKIKISLESTADDLSFLDSEYPFDITFDRLKVIEIGCVGSEFHWMKLIKFLLASSPMLEKMICEPQLLDESNLLKLATKLLKYPRASSNAKILFLKS